MDQVSVKEEVDLKRADWRFLLPRPSTGCFKHLVVLGGPPGLTERMHEAGIAQRISDHLPVSGRVDALALLHDAPVGLEQAVKSLAAGGALYYEIKRRSFGKRMAVPSRVRRTMQSLGLVPTGAFLVTPDFANYRQYVPLDSGGALSWYFAERFAPLSLSQYVLNLTMRTIGRRHRMLAWLMPNYAVTATLGKVRNDAPAILEHQAMRQECPASPVYPLLLTNGIDEGSRVVLLPFAENASQPTVVLKVGRLLRFNSVIEREQRTLEETRAPLDSSLRDSIPRPLGVLYFEGLAVGAESYAPGRSMLILGWQWRRSMCEKVEDMQLAAHWLSRFHRQPRVDKAVWGKEDLLLHTEALMMEYNQAFGTTPEEELLFARVRAHIESLEDAAVPLVLRHLDFSPTNVYRKGQSLTVIDWEDRAFARDRLGPALCDLFYFVTYWSFAVHSLHSAEAQILNFRQLFMQFDIHEYSADMAREAIARYMTELNIDRRLYPILLVYSSIEHALERLNRRSVFTKSQLETRSGNLYVMHVGSLATYMTELFAMPSVWPATETREARQLAGR